MRPTTAVNRPPKQSWGGLKLHHMIHADAEAALVQGRKLIRRHGTCGPQSVILVPDGQSVHRASVRAEVDGPLYPRYACTYTKCQHLQLCRSMMLERRGWHA